MILDEFGNPMTSLDDFNWHKKQTQEILDRMAKPIPKKKSIFKFLKRWLVKHWWFAEWINKYGWYGWYCEQFNKVDPLHPLFVDGYEDGLDTYYTKERILSIINHLTNNVPPINPPQTRAICQILGYKLAYLKRFPKPKI